MQRPQGHPSDGPRVTVGDLPLGTVVLVRHVPEDVVLGIEVDGRIAHPLRELAHDADVVVMTMGEENGLDLSRSDRLGDGIDIMGGIDDDDLGAVPDDPHVVVDVPRPAVEGERSGRDDMLDRSHQSTTTDRRTLPSPIFSNASSTSPMPMRSVTNFSSGRRPCS